jgi:multiple antibiotic resistance protein
MGPPDMNAFSNTFLLCFAALFPIINPIGNAPLFLRLTRMSGNAERAVLARKVAFNSLCLLLGSLFLGSYVLQFFGISLPIVRIGGGLVVMAFGWKLLNSGEGPDEEAPNGVRHASIDSFYPLTMPLTVGPGSIAVAIAVGSQRPKIVDVTSLLLLEAGAVAGIIAIAAAIYLCYRYAENTVARLGVTGTNVVVRLSAFLLLCVGIQILWGGLSELAALPRLKG